MQKIRLLSVLLASALAAGAATFVENFSADPAARGWQAFGQAGLFHWNATNRNLEVTWDSSGANSYFCRATGTNLTASNDFLLAFDLRLADIAIGVDPNKPFTFQIAVGLFNLAQATNAGFVRGSGFESPNLVELDYFPDSGFGATVAPTLISSNNEFNAGGFTFPLELAPAALYRVTLTYTAADRTLRTVMTSNGVPFGPVQDATLGANFSNFAVDHFGVASYSDAGQFPGFEGSVLAHGVVDNFIFASPPPVTKFHGGLADGRWQTRLRGETGWLYTLEASTNLVHWLPVAPAIPGDGGSLTLQDTNPPAGNVVYRVRAELP